MAREDDVTMAVQRGWLGPVKWADDEEGRDPYMFPPDAMGYAAAITNDRNWDNIVPRFSEGEEWQGREA